jgi:hypothetical protein
MRALASAHLRKEDVLISTAKWLLLSEGRLRPVCKITTAPQNIVEQLNPYGQPLDKVNVQLEDMHNSPTHLSVSLPHHDCACMLSAQDP